MDGNGQFIDDFIWFIEFFMGKSGVKDLNQSPKYRSFNDHSVSPVFACLFAVFLIAFPLFHIA